MKRNKIIKNNISVPKYTKMLAMTLAITLIFSSCASLKQVNNTETGTTQSVMPPFTYNITTSAQGDDTSGSDISSEVASTQNSTTSSTDKTTNGSTSGSATSGTTTKNTVNDTKDTDKTTTKNSSDSTSKTTPKATNSNTPTEDNTTHNQADGFYKLLSAEDKQIYDVITSALNSYNESFKVTLPSNRHISEYFNFMTDYAFYSTGRKRQYKFTFADTDSEYIQYTVSDYMDIGKDEFNRNKKALESKANTVVSGIKPNASEYERFKYIHDYIVKNTVYDANGKNAYTAYGALVDGKAVCQGYSLALQMLLNRVGIESVLVTGTSLKTGENHMWNKVKLNGNWYNVDITWNDPTGLSSSYSSTYVSYNYFNITDGELAIDHSTDSNPFVTFPKATATADNYFVKSKLVATSLDEANKILSSQLDEYVKSKNDTNRFLRVKLTGGAKNQEQAVIDAFKTTLGAKKGAPSGFSMITSTDFGVVTIIL